MKHLRPKFLDLLMPGIQSSFQDEFARQTLLNEKKRVTIIALLVFLILCMQLFLHFVSPDFIMQKYPHAREGTKYSVFVLGLFLTYELLARKAFSIFIEKKTQPPEIIRYVNAFIETSLPSVGLLIFARFQSPTDAILSPIILLYFFFIMLSTMRLNVKLSMFTASVAAIE